MKVLYHLSSEHLLDLIEIYIYIIGVVAQGLEEAIVATN